VVFYRMTMENERAGLYGVHKEIKDLVERSGYEYVWSELVQEEGRHVLRVYIDSLGGINVRDCETVSRRLSRMLDESDPGLPEKYFLQVSSPGVERPLIRISDYERFSGKRAKIRLKNEVSGKKSLTGSILAVKGDSIDFDDDDDGLFNIEFVEILKGNLLFDLPVPQKHVNKGKKKRRQQ